MSMKKEHRSVKTTSFLGESTYLEGTLTIKGGLRVDGQIRGQVHSESMITLGDNAVVEADITARTVISSGTIRGDIHLADYVQISLPGSIEGSIETRELILEKGVFFDGSCKIIESDA